MAKNIIVVTGASSGMGRAFAKKIVKKEKVDEIWVIARRLNLLEELKDEITECKVVPLQIDLRDKTQINEVYKKRLEEEKPVIKVLGCCAGFGKFAHFEKIDLQTEIDMVDVNFSAYMIMTYLSIPYMANPSNIMMIASGSSSQPVPYQTVYGATKAAVLSFARSMNRELKYKGIHVLAVVPLWVQNTFMDTAIDPAMNPVVLNYTGTYKGADVMDRAIRDLYTKKDVSKLGFYNKFQHAVVKILPHKWIMNIWLKQNKLDGTPEVRKEKDVKIKGLNRE
ncbi:MAG: SDR family NAD(P)-dependent oxidoreductase [Gammaproteobacteria bacterium]|nr:SDR family NAD(P)-dependent oxidoreductase [Gammaproteobacteria bacterium]